MRPGAVFCYPFFMKAKIFLLLLAAVLPAGAQPAPKASPLAPAYHDTGNPADPAYLKGFSLKRDVFAAALALHKKGLKVLLAWDIDLTLGTPLAPGARVSLGSDPWWNEQSEALLKTFTAAHGQRKDKEGRLLWSPGTQAGYDARFARLIALNAKLHEQIALKPVEAFVPGAIKKAQAAGLPMLAVTARGPEMEAATLQDLKGDLGIDFSPTAPGGPGFALEGFKVSEKARPSLYRGGVLLTSGQNKGEQLLHLLKAAAFTPDIVFFVDDSEKNARAVAEALEAAALPARVFRYGKEDPRVKAYFEGPQPCVAQAQLRAFAASGRIPPDSAVKAPACDAAENFRLIYGSSAPAAGF